MDRRLAAILAADVVGYSRLIGEDEEGTLRALKSIQNEVVAPKISGHQGRIFKLVGDGVLAEFQSVVEAVRCAMEVQVAMAARNSAVAEDRRILYRIGINLGDVVAEGDDLFGDGINVASRLEGLADPGGICVSRSVHHEVRDRLSVAFEDMGEIAVKNIVRPVRTFRVRLDGTPRGPSQAPPKRKFAGGRLAAAGAVVLFAMVVAVLWWRPWESVPAIVASGHACIPVPDRPSVAVLPFASLSAEADQAYFAAGLGDDLITQLSQISGLFVIDHNSAAGYKDRTVKAQDVACDLGVRYILEGSVQRSGGRLRINVTLVDTEAGNHLWSDKYDRDASDVFAVQDDVIARVVSALRVTLSGGERQQIARIPTTNLEAYDYYLRAEAENFYKANYQTIGRSLGFYQKAITLDQDFADAYAGYARAAVEIWRLGYDHVLSPPVARKAAYDAAGRALALDPGNARAFAALAILQLGDRRFDEAISSAHRAVTLNPNDAEAAANLAFVLAYSGQAAEAVTAIEQALRLNPAPPPGFQLLAGTVFYIARQYDRAIAALEAVRTLWPSVETVHEFLAASYARMDKLDLARREVLALKEVYPDCNLALYRLHYSSYYRSEQDLGEHIDALKLAGIPDWPFGLEAKPEDRIVGQELRTLVDGRTWNGRIWAGPKGPGVEFVQQIDAEDHIAYRTPDTFMTGNVRFDSDSVCARFDGFQRDHWVCGAVYRNKINPERGGDYLYLSPILPRYFNVTAS